MDVPLYVELIFIIFLILLNAFFAASEIAIISVRKSRIKELIAKNNKTASVLMDLQEDPDRLLASIQVGVTFVGSLASAVAGRNTANAISLALAQLPLIAPYSEALAVGCVVFIVSYLSLVIGELVPKSLALQKTERIALMTAPIIVSIARLTKPIVNILTVSKNTVLQIMGQKTSYKDPLISEEEVKLLIKEGSEKGVFDQTEQKIIQKVFQFTDTLAKEIMTPRFKVEGIDINATDKEILTTLVEKKVSRFPVYDGELDNVIGILHNKDIFEYILAKKKLNLRKLIYKPMIVPESMTVSHLLAELQKNHQQMAIVINEYGGMEGVVTVEDIVEELVGEIRDETDHDEIKEITKISDDEYIVEGALTIGDLKEKVGVELPEDEDFDTIAGFLLSELQAAPEKGQQVLYKKALFKVEKVVEHRIAEVRVILRDDAEDIVEAYDGDAEDDRE